MTIRRWPSGTAPDEPGRDASLNGSSTPAGGDTPAAQPHLHLLVAAVHGPSVALSGPDGQMRPGGTHGLFVSDVRILSELVCTLEGREPEQLAYELLGGPQNRFELAVFHLVPGEADPSVFLTRHREVLSDGMRERFTISSRWREPLGCTLALQLASDLAAMPAVKSGQRHHRCTAEPAASGLRWPLDEGGAVEATTDPPPGAVDAGNGVLSWRLGLAPRSSVEIVIEVRVGPLAGAGAVVAAPGARALARAELAEPAVVAVPPPGSPLPACGLQGPDERLVKLLARSVADLRALRMVTLDRPDDVFVAAGIPWFLTLFGRDSIWTARMLLPLGTGPALGTLRTLAHRQGRTVDPATGEQPGKIMHELRRAPTSFDLWSGGGEPRRPLTLPPVYYGSVDATALWVCLLHDAWRWGLPEADVEPLLEPMLGCLSWIEEHGLTRDGFVAYLDESGAGLANQGWKDSHDAVQFRDGRLASPPISLCEVQAYAYEAATGGAELLDAFGRPGSDRWRELAAGLAARVRERFWVSDDVGPYLAMALDGRGRPVDGLSSNLGHLLGTGLLDPGESETVAARLGRPELDCGFGLRTLASSNAGFNPLSYHAGSVWPHDTAIAIAGLTRAGGPAARRAASSLAAGLIDAAEHFDYRLPELYGGHDRAEHGRPLPYPAACRPQAWSAAAAVQVLASLIGIRPDVPGERLDVSGPPLCRRLRVEGLVVAGRPLAIELGDGAAVLDGVPPGLSLSG